MSETPTTLRRSIAELNELIDYWDRIVVETSRKRTALTSGLIPVREYVSAAGVEAWLRWPAIFAQLDDAMGAAELGAAMRGPGTNTTNAHPYALPVISLSGWRILSAFSSMGIGEQVPDIAERIDTVLDFWVRFVEPWRGDGFRQCYDAADRLPTCDRPIIDALYDGRRPVADEHANRRARRIVAGLQQYLFLMYLDTRLGTGDSGPYPLPNGRTMIVREFSGLSSSWIPWSHVAKDVSHGQIVVGLTYRPGVSNRVTDLSTTFSIPTDNLEYLEAITVSVPQPDGSLHVLDDDEVDELMAQVKVAQTAAYRLIATWTFEEKVHNGAHVYFRGLLWPFTSMAGIDDQIDWTMPSEAAAPLWPIFNGGLPAESETPMGYPIFERLDDA